MAASDIARDKAANFLRKFHDVGDSFNTSRMPEIYSKDAVLQFANLDLLIGIKSIVSFFEQQFQHFTSMKHEVLYFDSTGDNIYQAVQIKYIIKGDAENTGITIPAFAAFHSIPAGEEEAGKLKACEIYLDPTPVHLKMEEVAQKQLGGTSR